MSSSPPLCAAAILPLLFAAGCLAGDLSEETFYQCESSHDCEQSAGEICDEGICWGDPPAALDFAAVLVPPSARADLATSEIWPLEIGPDGEIKSLRFADSVEITGRVTLACPDGGELDCEPDRTVAAQITVERGPSFEGGPAYRRQIVSRADAAAGESNFSLRLPSDGAEYQVTVVQELLPEVAPRGPETLQAPPMSTSLVADRDRQVVWVLGEPSEQKTIRGCIVNSLGKGSPYSGMQVSALGRWSSSAPLQRASAVVSADSSGCFELAVPIAMEDKFDVVAKPPPDMALPTVRLADELVPDPDPEKAATHTIAPLVMPNSATATAFRLPIRGVAGDGSTESVPGALVTLTTNFPLPPSETRSVRVTYSAQAVTDGLTEAEPGVAILTLFPGSFEEGRTYSVRVLPPLDSEFASLFAGELSVGTGHGATVLEALELARRIPVSGQIVTHAGDPLRGAPVSLAASSAVGWRLGEQAAASGFESLQFPTDTTSEDGSFLVWLDPSLVGEAAAYDIDVSPPTFADAPPWTFEAALTGNDGPAVDLGPLPLPEASFARGRVLDPASAAVAGAELRLYQLPDQSICTRLDISSSQCAPRARLRGIWESDAEGRVRLILPDP